jgi:hypothetical protein
LLEGDYSPDDDETEEAVTHPKTKGTTVDESISTAEEQTCTDNTTKGEHLMVSKHPAEARHTEM